MDTHVSGNGASKLLLPVSIHLGKTPFTLRVRLAESVPRHTTGYNHIK